MSSLTTSGWPYLAAAMTPVQPRCSGCTEYQEDVSYSGGVYNMAKTKEQRVQGCITMGHCIKQCYKRELNTVIYMHTSVDVCWFTLCLVTSSCTTPRFPWVHARRKQSRSSYGPKSQWNDTTDTELTLIVALLKYQKTIVLTSWPHCNKIHDLHTWHQIKFLPLPCWMCKKAS